MNEINQSEQIEIKKALRSSVKINEALIKSDPKLKKIIDYCGPIEIQLRDDYFFALARSIIGQQLSTKAARTILGRVINLLDDTMTPKKILEIEDENFRIAGVSYSKIKYLKNLSKSVVDKTLNLNNLEDFENEEVVKILTEVKGIGEWTAEMFLIFSLGRKDVFSFGDAGLKRSIKRLYKMNEILEKEDLKKITDRWKPYRTIASLYLWEAIDKDLYNVKL